MRTTFTVIFITLLPQKSKNIQAQRPTFEAKQMYGKTARTPMDEVSAWLKVVLSTVDLVSAIVAHESCHYNQRYNTAPDQRHLLGKSLQEGACGRNINEHLKVYGRTHAAEIWRDFEADMYKPDISKWIYNAVTSSRGPITIRRGTRSRRFTTFSTFRMRARFMRRVE
jgi:hypothetical protein